MPEDLPASYPAGRPCRPHTSPTGVQHPLLPQPSGHLRVACRSLRGQFRAPALGRAAGGTTVRKSALAARSALGRDPMRVFRRCDAHDAPPPSRPPRYRPTAPSSPARPRPRPGALRRPDRPPLRPAARGRPVRRLRRPGQARPVRRPLRPPAGACDNGAHAHERTDPRGAEGRHRSRAAALHRRARDGAVHRHQGRRDRRRDRFADDPRLPDQEPFPDRCRGGGLRRRRREPRQRRLRRPHRPGEGRPAAEARTQRAPRGGARAGVEHHLRRLRQGRRRQVVADRQPRRRAARRRQVGRRPRRGRVGLLDPPHARPRGRAPARVRPTARSSRWTPMA